MIDEIDRKFKKIISWWIIYFISTICFSSIVLLFYKNQINNKKVANQTRVFICLIIILFSAIYYTGLFCNSHEKTILLSIILLFLHVLFMIINMTTKIISRSYIIYFVTIFILMIAINFLLLIFYSDILNIFFVFSKEIYHIIIFSNQLGCSTLFLFFVYTLIYFSKNISERALLELSEIIVQSEEECPICLDTLNIHSYQNTISTSCNHVFHKECISRSFQINTLCPICRKELNVSNLCF